MDAESVSSKKSEELIIVVHIEEGVNLNTAETVLIQSKLSGNVIDAEPMKPGNISTIFDCNLVFETDKSSIKRMKLENIPLKVDVFALKSTKNSAEPTREHIGYLLIPVKTIPNVNLTKAIQMKPRWMKLIGLSREWRAHRPELLLNVIITTRDFLTCDKETLLGLESGDSVIIEENPPCMLSSQNGIFIRLLEEEGLLQVGNIDTCHDIFMVKILMKDIRYLENVMLKDLDQDFFLNYTLLGNSHSRALEKKFNRVHQIQEKVSIKFRSSLSVLREYFESIFFIPFELVSGNQSIGSAEIKLNEFIKSTDLKEFLEKNPSEVCESDGICNINSSIVLPNTNQPILEFNFWLQYVGTTKLRQRELLDNIKRHHEIDSQAGGDQASVSEVPLKAGKVRKTLSDIQEVRSESDGSHQNRPKSMPKRTSSNLAPKEQVEKADIESILNTQQDGAVSELPRVFSYNLQLSSIKFNLKPENGVWQFIFFHDKADMQRIFVNKEFQEADFTSENTIEFKDLELKLYFSSHTNNIMDLIKSSNLCTLSIKGPRGTSAKANLDCKSLLIGNKNKQSGMILLQNQTEKVTAMAKIFVYLEDLGINFNAVSSQTVHETIDQAEVTAEKPTLDENLTYKMIEELEEWKEEQKNHFIDDLKKKEFMFLENMKSIWNQKQAVYEQNLVKKSDQLNKLTESLQEAKSKMLEKSNQQTNDYREIEKMKGELERNFENQLLGIRERARRMEDDLLHEVKLKDIKLEEVERCNQFLEKENFELRQQVESLQCELCDLKASLVPKEEVEKLLQEMRLLSEKCEAVQQSKLFYKEQWAKAVRECHKIRRENISDKRGEIFSARCDRLCDALEQNNEDYELDKQELDELKCCLNSRDNEI